MIINGLPVPNLLVELIDSGKWERLSKIGKLKALTGFERPQELSFLSLAGIEGMYDTALSLIEEGYGQYYGISSSRIISQPIDDRTTLDIEKALFLATNIDEDVIGLDYRDNLYSPKVVVSEYNGARSQFAVIAETFKDFVKELGIIG